MAEAKVSLLNIFHLLHFEDLSAIQLFPPLPIDHSLRTLDIIACIPRAMRILISELLYY